MRKYGLDMENYRNNQEIPPEGVDTPNGYLYYPPKQGRQVLFVIASFFSAIILGLIISSIPGDLPDLAAGLIYFIFILIFILGYGAWVSLVGALLFNSIKLPIIKIIYRFFVHREKPGSITDFLPTKEKAVELMVHAQKAARTFFILSWPIGIAGGLTIMFMKTSVNSIFLFLLVTISAVTFGYVLSYFGRRGYLPFPEE